MSERIHSSLRRLVGEQADRADGGDRGDVDDDAASLLAHHWQDVLAGEKYALEIHGENAVPGFLGEVQRTAIARADADVVVEDVDSSVGAAAGFGEPAAIPITRDVG